MLDSRLDLQLFNLQVNAIKELGLECSGVEVDKESSTTKFEISDAVIVFQRFLFCFPHIVQSGTCGTQATKSKTRETISDSAECN